MTYNPAPILCFLSDNPHEIDLCIRYWSQAENGTWSEKVASLLQDDGRSQRELLALIGSKCDAYVRGIKCHDCGSLSKVRSRQQVGIVSRSFVSNGHIYRCPRCGEAAKAQKNIEAAAEEERKKEQLVRLLAPSEASLQPVDYEALGYTDTFFLYSVLVAAGECWQGRNLASLRAQSGNLAPTLENAAAIYTRLCFNRIITPSSSSSPRILRFVDEASGKFDFSPLEANWTLAPPSDGAPIEGLLTLLETVLSQPDQASVAGIWLQVAEAECERYFGELCERYRFSKDVVFTDKVADSIRYCLDRVSLPQVWNILWCTMRDIAALIQEGKYIRPHVYNMIAGNIRRDIDRRLANNTPIRPWTRHRSEKEPIITGILFDKILGKGNLAFETMTAKNVAAFFL
jgi:hypothetical protein